MRAQAMDIQRIATLSLLAAWWTLQIKIKCTLR
jgi:hypothetical protein